MSALSEPGACFVNARARALARLENRSLDKAPAGGVDVAALPLVEAINGGSQYVTTSTCAGRCAVYASPVGGGGKRRGKWLFNSHEGVAGEDVSRALSAFEAAEGETWAVALKFEPPIAHVRCADLDAARRLFSLALARGYRESGCVLSSEAPVVAIRSVGAAMDAPLGEMRGDGSTRYAPDEERLAYLARDATRRLGEARAKLELLVQDVRETLHAAPRPKRPDVAVSAEAGRGVSAVVAPKRRAKDVKVALEAQGAFNKAYNVTPWDDGGLAVPLLGLDLSDAAKDAVLAALDGAELVVVRDATLPRSKRFRDVSAPSLSALCAEWATTRGVSLDPVSKWTRLGDDAILVPRALKVPDDDIDFWAKVATSATAHKVFRDAEVAPDGVRSSGRNLLFPRDASTWVTIKENGVMYSFNAATTMFAKGNNTERMRHGTLDCEDQTIVDLYAGIGYFTLPMLLHGKARFVHCCEWAPETAKALAKNLEDNKVPPDAYALHVGDNASTAPNLGRVADRVSCGLTPSSKGGWPLACLVLKDTGGIVHVHENVKVPGASNDDDRRRFSTWGNDVADAVAAILTSQRGAPWAVTCAHVSRVKDYAPRVHHLVADLVCRPATA